MTGCPSGNLARSGRRAVAAGRANNVIPTFIDLDRRPSRAVHAAKCTQAAPAVARPPQSLTGKAIRIFRRLLSSSAFAQFPSWPGLSRPSTSFLLRTLQGVDARDKPGHDERSVNGLLCWPHFESGSQEDGGHESSVTTAGIRPRAPTTPVTGANSGFPALPDALHKHLRLRSALSAQRAPANSASFAIRVFWKVVRDRAGASGYRIPQWRGGGAFLHPHAHAGVFSSGILMRNHAT
jgi:hypothetical protein